MDRSQMLDNLVREHGLADADIYLLELIPLIEMIWADDENQPPELRLLYEFTLAHIAELNSAAGMEVVDIDAVNSFLDRFAHRRPAPALLAELRGVAIEFAHERGARDGTLDQRERIIDFCLDIAAACAGSYPYGQHERIIDAEKKLLRALMRALDKPADAPLHAAG